MGLSGEEVSMIKIGTSGFSFPDWKGTVYPKEIKDRDMLSYYERELGLKTLEVNFTYYTLPSPNSFIGMSKKTSHDFEFVVKCFKGMTHEIRDKATKRIIDNRDVFDKFLYSLQPLVLEGKLGCVLAQFPYSFFPNSESFAYLRSFKERLGEIPLVVEFRNIYWLKDSTFSFLKDIGTGYCVVDEPKLPKLMPFTPRATSDVGYFRMHGRNPNWFNVPTSVRYDYLYSEEELRGFIQPIREIKALTGKTLIFFNNCHGGSAARNALEFLRMLS
jgi:uncharacterized protein YecE (DUF72 family)